jgi:hypothetical protein
MPFDTLDRCLGWSLVTDIPLEPVQEILHARSNVFIHGPHHRHPRLTQDQLEGKLDKYLASDCHTIYPVHSSYLRATTAMMPHLLTDPGIARNAGSSVPGETRLADVANFPTDVIRDMR